MKIQGSPFALPNFLLVGAGKSGTTSLYYYLSQHPEIFMSPIKEPRFFSMSKDRTFNGPGDYIAERSTITNFEDYCALFKNSENYKARGEASIENLFFYREAIPNIHKYIGDPKIIIILRNPVDRAYSAYSFLRRDGWEKLSFKDALRQEQERKRLGYKWMWRYREVGLYYEQVKAYLNEFSKVKIFLYDDLKNDPLKLIQNMFSFLEVDTRFIPEISIRHNASGNPHNTLLNSIFVKPKTLHKILRNIGYFAIGRERWINLREKLRGTLLKKPNPIQDVIANELKVYYKNDILKLQNIIGIDLTHWLARQG
jgi:hypothetical protein